MIKKLIYRIINDVTNIRKLNEQLQNEKKNIELISKVYLLFFYKN